MQAWRAFGKATPGPDGQPRAPATAVRHDRIDLTGFVTLRHRSKPHHVGIGRAHNGKRLLLPACDPDIRVVAEDGEVLRRSMLDPTIGHQPQTRDSV
jgi:hypothetical protein